MQKFRIEKSDVAYEGKVWYIVAYGDKYGYLHSDKMIHQYATKRDPRSRRDELSGWFKTREEAREAIKFYWFLKKGSTGL